MKGDDEDVDNLMLMLAKVEALAKASMIEHVEAQEGATGDNSAKILLMTGASMGVAAAALHAAVEATQQGDQTVGRLALGLYQETVQPELLKLLHAMGMLK